MPCEYLKRTGKVCGAGGEGKLCPQHVGATPYVKCQSCDRVVSTKHGRALCSSCQRKETSQRREKKEKPPAAAKEVTPLKVRVVKPALSDGEQEQPQPQEPATEIDVASVAGTLMVGERAYKVWIALDTDGGVLEAGAELVNE